MILLKKIIFAPFFLIAFAVLIYQLNPILKSYDIVFSLSVETLIQLATTAALIITCCFLFILFATLAQNWRLILPVIAFAAALPFIFLEPALAVVFAVAVFISFLLAFLSLDSSLKTYLNFQPAELLGPGIKKLAGLVILAFCLVYFFSSSKLIGQKGFEIPDSLIDTALKVAPTSNLAQQSSPELPDISSDQIEQLKKNPDLLKQYGLDPKMLDNLTGSDLIKKTVKEQVQNLVKPYLNFIPAVLAIVLFLTLQSLVSLLSILTTLLISLTFFILEKTNFVRFETEQRPVKKLIV